MPSELKKQILEINKTRSQEFRKTIDERREFRRTYRIEFAATMCMDGRVNLTRCTKLPSGIVSPFRNIGGKYDLGWPLLRESLNELESYAYQKRRLMLLAVTYHFSKGDTHRGCAGFKYKTDTAIEEMQRFKAQVDKCYRGRIKTVLIGIETDSEALILHGENGQTINMLQFANDISESALLETIMSILPGMHKRVYRILVRLFSGNAEHIKEVKQENRVLDDYKHNERVLAIGQGFDWLKNQNLALIIGPCDPVLSRPIVTAANIIRTNWKEGRIPDTGLLLISTPYRKYEDRLGAMEQSRYLADLAKQCIAEQLPDMAKFFEPLVGILDLETRDFEVIE